MSKQRAILYAVGAPLMYSLLQVAVLSGLSYFAIFDVVMDSGVTLSYEELLETVLEKTMALSVRYGNVILIAAGAMFVGIMLLVYRRRKPGMWQLVRLTTDIRGQTLFLAALAGFGFNMVSSALLTGLPIPEEWMSGYDEVMDMLLSGNPILTLATAGLIIPFVEELVFRGFTHRYLEIAVGRWTAVVLQALLFGWFHGVPVQIAYTIFAGLLMGVLYMWTRNLWASIVFHVSYNLSGFLLEVILSLIYGAESDVPLPPVSLAVMAASGMTLVIFCVRQLHAFYVKPASAEQ